MNLNFVANLIPQNDDPITAKIKETIDFQKSYADEEYRSEHGQDYDEWYIEWLRYALKIVAEHPPLVKEKIVYRDIPSDRVVIQRIFQKKYITINWEEVLEKMVKLCAEYEQILNDKTIKLHFGIDMEDIRKDLQWGKE